MKRFVLSHGINHRGRNTSMNKLFTGKYNTGVQRQTAPPPDANFFNTIYGCIYPPYGRRALLYAWFTCVFSIIVTRRPLTLMTSDDVLNAFNIPSDSEDERFPDDGSDEEWPMEIDSGEEEDAGGEQDESGGGDEGVDKTNMLVSLYRNMMKTRKWYKRIIFHLIDFSVVNAWALYRATDMEQQLVHFKSSIALSLIRYEAPTPDVNIEIPERPDQDTFNSNRVCRLCNTGIFIELM